MISREKYLFECVMTSDPITIQEFLEKIGMGSRSWYILGFRQDWIIFM